MTGDLFVIFTKITNFDQGGVPEETGDNFAQILVFLGCLPIIYGETLNMGAVHNQPYKAENFPNLGETLFGNFDNFL